MGKRNNLSVVELTQTEFTDLKAGSRLDRGSIYLVDGKFYTSLGDEIIAGAEALAAAVIPKSGFERSIRAGDSLQDNGFNSMGTATGATVTVTNGIADITVTLGNHNYSAGNYVRVLPPQSLRTRSTRYNYHVPILSAPSATRLTFPVQDLADGTYTFAGEAWKVTMIQSVSAVNYPMHRARFLRRPEVPIGNFAIGGTNTSILADQAAQILASGLAWTRCDLSIGTNDILGASAATAVAVVETALSRIAAFVQAIATNGRRVRLWLPHGFDTSKTSGYAAYMNAAALYMQKRAFEIAATLSNLDIVDSYGNLADGDSPKSNYTGADGIHCNGISSMINARLSAAYPTPQEQSIPPYWHLSGLDGGSVLTGDTYGNIFAAGMSGSAAVNGAGDGVHGIVAGSTKPTLFDVPWLTTNVAVTTTAGGAPTLATGEDSNRANQGDKKVWRFAATATNADVPQFKTAIDLAAAMTPGAWYVLSFLMYARADAVNFYGMEVQMFGNTGGQSFYPERDVNGSSTGTTVKSGNFYMPTLIFCCPSASEMTGTRTLFVKFLLGAGGSIDFEISKPLLRQIPKPY